MQVILLTVAAAVATVTFATGPAEAALSGCTHNMLRPHKDDPRIKVEFPTTNSGRTNCYLAQGMNNAAVKALQKTLNVNYGAALLIDGSFGPATKAALIKAQKEHAGARLAQDGVFGPETRRAMKWRPDHYLQWYLGVNFLNE